MEQPEEGLTPQNPTPSESLRHATYSQTIMDLPIVQASELPDVLLRSLNLACGLASGPVWLLEQMRGYLGYEMKERFEFKEPEEVQEPDPSVAGPLVESLKFNLHRPELRRMYINLLATSIDKETASEGHPAFVEIIRQLTPDEARVAQLFADQEDFPVVSLYSRHPSEKKYRTGFTGDEVVRNFSLLGYEASCDHPEFTPRYIDNLCRLRLSDLSDTSSLADKSQYDPLQNHSDLEEEKRAIKAREDRTVAFRRKTLFVTDFGEQFCEACVVGVDVG